MSNMISLVLAGGRGKRMGILCQAQPKPLLPFAGTYRVIDFSLSNCIHSGINNISVLVDYEREQMKNYLSQITAYMPSLRDYFCVLEPKDGRYHGTADAVYQNLDIIQLSGVNRVLILSGDHIYQMNYRRMLDFHEKVDADVTVAVVTVPIEEAHRFGTVSMNSEGRIIKFSEKSGLPESNIASMGIYIFNREILTRHLIEDAADDASPHDFGYAVIPKLIDGNRVFAYRYDGYWRDVGTIESYYTANLDYINMFNTLNLDVIHSKSANELITSRPIIYGDAIVRNSIISPGCIIKGEVENSVLSPNVRIGAETVLRNSIVMADTVIGKHSTVDCCILSEGINIPEFCNVGFREPSNNITLITKKTEMPVYEYQYGENMHKGLPGNVISSC